MANLLHHFAASVRRHPDRVAIIDGQSRETSFAALQNRAAGLAAAWRDKGIGPGDRVLMAMPVDADLYASLAALWQLGATAVLPEPAMGLAGLRHAARATKPVAFCASGYYRALKYLLPELWSVKLLSFSQSAADFVGYDPKDTDIALISFTSGTTGKPKAIARSHGFLMAQHDAIAPLLHSDSPERDLVAFPVFTLINIASGQTSILPNWKMSRLDQLDPAQLTDWLTKQKASRALLPPSLCDKLAKGQSPKDLHTVFTGGGPVFPDVVAALTMRVISVYGSTEAEPIAHLGAEDVTAEDKAKMQAGGGLLVGHPVAQINVRIIGEEIQVAGAHVNAGYLDPKHDAENKVADGGVIWHRTGDAGCFDDQGRLWLWGRIGTDIATPNGQLFPFAIEAAARGWAGVEHSALIALNDQPVLVVQGDSVHRAEWAAAAQRFGVGQVRPIAKIPMDARHGSKIDRAKLLKLLG
ncbi:MAG: AMP-binding protein [Rhodobacteraceae bacterium]|nr:AMP-binding protein [Paracoccaceae bacterium]